MHKVSPRLLTFAIALGMPAAAAAHHGWGWTQTEESRLTGTIQSISFGNPHMHLQLQNDQGTWEVDLSPPIQARRSGFGPDAAKPGDRVVLTGHRADRTTIGQTCPAPSGPARFRRHSSAPSPPVLRCHAS